MQKVAPRSYVVETPEGVTYRRNRRHVPDTVIDTQTPPIASVPEPTSPEPAEEPVEMKRPGRVIKPPQRLIEEM